MLGRDSGSLGQLWVGSKVGLRARMQVERAKIFVANFSYLFGYSGVLHACCAGWCGREVARNWMPGLVLKFIPACTYSAWPEPHGTSRLQRFQLTDVSTRTGCINRVASPTHKPFCTSNLPSRDAIFEKLEQALGLLLSIAKLN